MLLSMPNPRLGGFIFSEMGLNNSLSGEVFNF